jgi:hypothetical protein
VVSRRFRPASRPSALFRHEPLELKPWLSPSVPVRFFMPCGLNQLSKTAKLVRQFVVRDPFSAAQSFELAFSGFAVASVTFQNPLKKRVTPLQTPPLVSWTPAGDVFKNQLRVPGMATSAQGFRQHPVQRFVREHFRAR